VTFLGRLWINKAVVGEEPLSENQYRSIKTIIDERDELLSELATACDLANTWARECNVGECRDPYSGLALRNLIDRIWSKASADLTESRRKADLWERLQESRTKEAEHAKTHCCGCDALRADCVCNVT